MTTSIATEIASRKNRPKRELSTFSRDFVDDLLREVTYATRVRFPSDHYQRDPIAFFREVLGVEPWSRQRQIVEAVRDYPRVAVCSGHKVSKSHTAAGLALWFYCSFPDARAILSSTTARQVDQILWRELRMMRARSGRCVACRKEDPEGRRITRPCPHSTLIEGEQGELARTGLKSTDFREIVGFTAREAEAVAGISGRNLLYIIDEASGVPDEIFEAIEGNRAGGARVLLLSNGTRNEGEFYEAFESKADYYHTIRVSSEETPNVIAGREIIPGLATREWVEEKKLEWGVDSALYRIRVKGEHAKFEEGRIFSVHAITEAERRWSETPEAGRLFIGVDPAGATGTGDESAFSARRGFRQLWLRALRGLNEEQHVVMLLKFLVETKLPRETPVVVIDRDGPIGARLNILLREYLEQNPDAFELVSVRASDASNRDGYDRMRDALIANLEIWLREGAIVEDIKLEKELHALEWKPNVNNKLKVTPKEVLRKQLGRSPDRLDALALSVWEPLSLRMDALTPSAQRQVSAQAADLISNSHVMDPYAGARAWRR